MQVEYSIGPDDVGVNVVQDGELVFQRLDGVVGARQVLDADGQYLRVQP